MTRLIGLKEMLLFDVILHERLIGTLVAAGIVILLYDSDGNVLNSSNLQRGRG